jgi:hypothetical protein
MKTTREIKLKSGVIVPAGIECKLSWLENQYFTTQVECTNGVKFSTLTSKLHDKITGVGKPPGEKTMWKWSNDGVAKTIFGARTEPDGTGPQGEPSWLLALGLI